MDCLSYEASDFTGLCLRLRIEHIPLPFLQQGLVSLIFNIWDNLKTE